MKKAILFVFGILFICSAFTSSANTVLIKCLCVLIGIILILFALKKKPNKEANNEPNPISRTENSPPSYVVFDMETTGVNQNSSEIIQLAALKVKNGSVVNEFCTYVRPVGVIPDTATRVNHITEDTVANAPCLKESLETFLNFIGNDLLIGYNIAYFDLPLLQRDLSAEFNKKLSNQYIDVYQMARKASLPTENNKLATIAEYFNLNTDNAHDALADCRMTNACFECLLHRVSPSIKNAADVTIPILQRPVEHEQSVKEMYLNSILTKYDDFSIARKKICLTGNFDLGDEPYLVNTITNKGGIVKDRISKQVDFLIVGNNKHEKWKFGAYGTKLVDANRINSEGGNIVIVSESVLREFLEKIQDM